MTQAFLGSGRTNLRTMSSGRSRHSRTSHYQSRGTKNKAVPRYKHEANPYAMENDLDAHLSHFSLSSNPYSGTASEYVSDWLHSGTGYSPDDDYSLSARPIPGHTATS